ncbi:MAG TPA: flagellar biosynthetic protein FliR [Clostridiales bacterium]|jgi:flagellar biosynthetic protein FliR|nr:flagellar biosynthetic protein FliR [Clostridiales bacterium]
MIEITISEYTLFLLVFTRITGAILFNPFLGRKNIPSAAQMGLSLVIALVITPTLPISGPETGLGIAFIPILLKELFIGYMIGLTVSFLTTIALTAGEITDMQIGLGMAKIFDPQSNVSMSMTGSIYNLMVTLVFFGMDGHLTLLRLVGRSCEVFPPGRIAINPQIGLQMGLLMGTILQLTIKVAMPIIAVELLLEAGLGVLMRSVPQINVFVAGIQIRLLVGLIMLVIMLPLISGIFGNAVDVIFDRLEEGMILMLGS